MFGGQKGAGAAASAAVPPQPHIKGTTGECTAAPQQAHQLPLTGLWGHRRRGCGIWTELFVMFLLIPPLPS